MKYRAFQVGGKYADVVFTTTGDFTVPEESHVADIASALGVDPKTVKVVETDTDPRGGEMIKLPEPPPREPTMEERIQALEDKVAQLESSGAVAEVSLK